MKVQVLSRLNYSLVASRSFESLTLTGIQDGCRTQSSEVRHASKFPRRLSLTRERQTHLSQIGNYALDGLE